MVNNFLFFVCVCVLLVTWRANGIVLYMYEGKVLMDTAILVTLVYLVKFYVAVTLLAYNFLVAHGVNTDENQCPKWYFIKIYKLKHIQWKIRYR